ncbi:MAG: GNAT family N-acetyltransferase, partial [Alphaproteobacteria bacterium]
MAEIHAACFTDAPKPWSAAAFRDMLGAPGVFPVALPGGFALGRVAAGEAELLTLAVHPDFRRQGHGRRLLAG